MSRIAVIGTAGRDAHYAAHLNRELWTAMKEHLAQRIMPDDMIVSGGAAWADHLAVDAFLNGRCLGLELFMPAPFAVRFSRFLGPQGSAGAAANYYHGKFSRAVGIASMKQITEAVRRGAIVHEEPAARGYTGMFRRNAKVAARCDACIAYTFGTDDAPNDGGTLDTWRQVSGTRIHVALGALVEHQI